jgi:TusA-related sulfurtransferase
VIDLDLRGVPCPMNWVRARVLLETLDAGTELRLQLDPGEPVESVPRSALEDGHNVAVDGTNVTIIKR